LREQLASAASLLMLARRTGWRVPRAHEGNRHDKQFQHALVLGRARVHLLE
jgi:hypothetical protein